MKIFIKLFIIYCFLWIIHLLLQKRNAKKAIEPIQPEKIPTETVEFKKYYCVSWDLKTGEVTEIEIDN